MDAYVPLDKSWIIRMGMLDIVNGYDDIHHFLDAQSNLGADLEALKRVAFAWRTDRPLEVGESGTLLRFVMFACWRMNMKRVVVKESTLLTRPITDDPSIVDWSQQRLLKLDNGTSQWASAAVLLGDKARLAKPPFKLQVTYDAVKHWNEARDYGRAWEPRVDQTISRQADAFVCFLNKQKYDFVPEQAEDFCFAYFFGFIKPTEGEKKWPSLRGHESDRIVESVESLERARAGEVILSKDHRVVQGLAMWGVLFKRRVTFKHPEAVAKSWPRFWEFLTTVNI